LVNKETILILILRLAGAMLVIAFVAVFLPYDVMNRIHQNMGLGVLPQTPIVDYLARSLSMFYGIHGVITLYISFHLKRYLSFLKLLCFLGVIMGIMLFYIDMNARMPAFWAYYEAPIVITLNVIIYILALLVEKKE